MRLAGLLFILTGLTFQSAVAQQLTDYERLARQNNRPNIYIDVITLPGADDNTVALTPIFRLNYDFLPFRKLGSGTNGNEFISTAGLNIEVFESPKEDLKPDKQVSIKGLKSIGRATWQDTAYAQSYDQTKSNERSLSGSMQVEVKSGYYTYFLKLNRAEGAQAQNSRSRNVRIFPYNKQQNGDILLGSSVDDLQNPTSLKLINMGNNVPYRQDFYALIHLPGYDEDKSYTVQINRVEPAEKEDEAPERLETMTEQTITNEQIHTGLKPALKSSSNGININLANTNSGHAYALVKIPNKGFPNAIYQLRVTTDGQNRPVAQRLFQSFWSDIPTSLLSLDVAIDMLRFIADKDTIKKIDDGSDKQRERKFREFWKQKDPTPDTEYNELQAEYYRRIDHSYIEFSSDRTLGFNSDRGNIYIRFGPPNDTERMFPTDGATTEVWTYDSRKFIFKATTGFGDFRLVSN